MQLSEVYHLFQTSTIVIPRAEGVTVPFYLFQLSTASRLCKKDGHEFNVLEVPECPVQATENSEKGKAS